MSRKRKLYWGFLSELGFSKFWRGKVGGVKGFFYRMDKPLTDEQKAYCLRFQNVSLHISQCEYAPEIRHNVVFLGDKCF